MPFVTFPPAQWPVAAGSPPTEEWYSWWAAIDRVFRNGGDPLNTFFETLGQSAGIDTQTASYVLALTDKGKNVEMNVAGANTLTVPPNASVAFAVGAWLNVIQAGAGITTLTPGAGVTIRNRNGLRTVGQWAMATIYQRAANEWVAGGDLMV